MEHKSSLVALVSGTYLSIIVLFINENLSSNRGILLTIYDNVGGDRKM